MVKDVLILSFFSALLALSSCENPIMPDPSPVNYEDFVDNQDQFPAFSPDGSIIAYFHFDTPQDPNYPTGLYIIDRDGRNRRLVIEGQHQDPDWSPDGKWLVFSSQGLIQKCTMDGDSLTTFDSPFEFGLFAPHYKSSNELLISYPFTADGGIYEIENFNKIKKLDEKQIIGGHPRYSPHSNQVLYYRGGSDVNISEIFIYSIENSTEIKVSNNSNDNRNPTWSPSGNQIAWSNNVRIFTMNADGSHQRYLHYGNRPSWSINNEIVFSFANADMSREVLYTIESDGSQLTQITF